MRYFSAILILLSSSLSAQVMQQGFVGSKLLSSTVVMVQDATVTPCLGNTTSTVTSQGCSLGTVPAHDRIICGAEAGDNSVAVQFSDNINGIYDVDVYGVNDDGFHQYLMTYHSPDTASGSTTVTATFSIAVDATGFSCAAYKNAASGSSILDPSFFGFNDPLQGGSASTSFTLTTSPVPSNNGELVFCNLSPGTPGDTVTATNGNYTIVGGNTTNSVFPMVWGQTTATGANCPYTISPADFQTGSGVAFLSSTGTGGMRPYQGMIETFALLTNGSVPTVQQLSQSVSGGLNPGFYGPELDYNGGGATFTITNTHTDLTGSTAGPTALLSSTLNLPAQEYQAGVGPSYTSWRQYTGNSAENLELTTGSTGDGVLMAVLPAASTFAFGYYLQWDIPNTDTNTHSYGMGGVITGHASTLGLSLNPTGSVMQANMTGGAGGSTALIGTVTASTTYWVTGQWTTGGTLSESMYSGCPSSCTLVGTAQTITDGTNTFPATFFKLGVVNGTGASGDHIWWRNFKVGGPGATYPLMP